jgi:hypothetical protein
MSNASLSFLPWVRQGAAAAIANADTLDATPAAVASVSPQMTLNGMAVTTTGIRLRGPGDAVGIDPNQVIRTDPRAGTNDFESNCFASIEFDRPDLPWLLTPARANSAKQLRPWLCLVVLRKQQGVSLSNTPGAALPVLLITSPARADLELPSLADCWAWAHAQVAADDSTAAQVNTALTGPPEQTLSRLVSPRILAPETDYIACVVPTFEVGRKAGLGLAVTDDDLKTLAPAWALKPPTPPAVLPDVLLPVYFQWEFRTGEGGNFESLATGLTSGVPNGLGARPIDISHPGFSAAGAKTANLQGALKPVGATTGAPPDTPLPAAFVTTLAGIINAPSTVGSVKVGGDPVLAPPIYGRWHAAKPSVNPAGATWLDQINLEPRWRATAAFGTRVVQTHQEALMASAWEQAAAVRSANQRLRQMQMSRTVGEVLQARHFAKFSDEMMARVAAPAFGRLRLPTGQTMVAQQAQSPLPAAANGASMRRIARARGPLSRRVAAQGAPRSANPTLVARMMASTLPPAPQAPAGPDFNILSMPASDFSGSWWGAFFVSPETAPAPRPIGQPVALALHADTPGFFRDAAVKHLARISAVPPPTTVAAPPPFVGVKDQVLQLLKPLPALTSLANAVVATGDNVLAPTAPEIPSMGLEHVMASPRFPSPMYEPLRDLSQDLLLPGLQTVNPETVLGLQTNRPFVEAYMVGLNHEMGRELLWRGFPTDQRGTYFTHFWGVGDLSSAPDDITDLNTWGTRALGAAAGSPATDQFVMLLRSSLLRRYPNASIYMTPALAVATAPGGLVPDPDPTHEKMPIFSGSMLPDICFFGFPVPIAAATGADGSAGYYLVLQEHPTEPRFGINNGTAPPGANYLTVGGPLPTGVLAWGTTSAAMAALTRRRPARVAIHAKRLINPAG